MARLDGQPQGELNIDDRELVRDEWSPGPPVVTAPFDGLALALCRDEARTAIGESVDERGCAGGRLEIELGARPIVAANDRWYDSD